MSSDPSSSREDFCRCCHLLYERRLVCGVGGNISARTGDNVFITPSGYSLRDIKPDMVTKLSKDGTILEGGTPTKDNEMHLGILRALPEINVVLHTHGSYITAATGLLKPGSDTLPPLTPGFVYYAHPLPMLPFFVPGTVVLANSVIKELSTNGRRAVLLQNHGLVSIGRDFQEATNIAEEIDEAARIFILTGGKASAIPPEDVDDLYRI